MKRISQKEINYTIEQYNYICSTIRAEQKENERITTLNVINDYITILKDERITKNQNNKCYNLVYTICSELEEYENNNNFVDYYEEETATSVRNNYFKALREVAPITKNKNKCDVVFYLNDKELARHDLINEFYGERESTIELLAYENNVDYEDIKIKVEEV